MTESTCKIDGKIEEVERLIKEGKSNISGLEQRLAQLKKEKDESTFEGKVRSFFGRSGLSYDVFYKGELNEQVHVYLDQNFYKFDTGALGVLPFKLVGMDSRSGHRLPGTAVIRLAVSPL